MKAKSSFAHPDGVSIVTIGIVGALSLLVSAFVAWALSCLGGAVFTVAAGMV